MFHKIAFTFEFALVLTKVMVLLIHNSNYLPFTGDSNSELTCKTNITLLVTLNIYFLQLRTTIIKYFLKMNPNYTKLLYLYRTIHRFINYHQQILESIIDLEHIRSTKYFFYM